MSLRPRLPGAAHAQIARTRMAPGGQAKPYSQSPLRLPGPVNRIRSLGAAPTAPETPLCADEDWALAAQSSTSARFEGSLGYVALSVTVNYDCTYSGTVTPQCRVYRGGAWTSWEATYPATITGPDLAGSRSFDFYGGDLVTMIEVQWDVPDAFTALCAVAVDNT